MAISKTGLKRNLGLKKPTSSASKVNSAPQKPWTKLFQDYGYSNVAIPTEDPPEDMSYGKILTWVTQDKWELPDDANLAIDIWMGRVSLYDYTPIPEAPKELPKSISKGGNEPNQPAPLKSKNRFMKKTLKGGSPTAAPSI